MTDYKIESSYVEPGFSFDDITVLAVSRSQGGMGENYKCLQRLLETRETKKLEEEAVRISEPEHHYNTAVLMLEECDVNSPSYNPKTLRRIKHQLPEIRQKKSYCQELLAKNRIFGFQDIQKLAEEYRIKRIGVRMVFGKYLSSQTAKEEAVLGVAEKFKKEIEIQSMLSHTNIATLYATRETGGQYEGLWAIIEYIDGMDLRTILEYEPRIRTGPRPLKPVEASAIILKIAQALKYAHSRGVINRDIKPGNLMLNFPDGEPKIVDWGIACFSGERILQVAGTSNYYSPEEARLELGLEKEIEIDEKRDFYPLGIVFYELLTSEKPFTDVSGSDIKNIANPDFKPKPIKRWYEENLYINPRIRKDYQERGWVYDRILDEVCLGMLEKDERKRLKDADLIAEKLETFLLRQGIKDYTEPLKELSNELDSWRRKEFEGPSTAAPTAITI